MATDQIFVADELALSHLLDHEQRYTVVAEVAEEWLIMEAWSLHLSSRGTDKPVGDVLKAAPTGTQTFHRLQAV
jgi:hypothetical protein